MSKNNLVPNRGLVAKLYMEFESASFKDDKNEFLKHVTSKLSHKGWKLLIQALDLNVTPSSYGGLKGHTSKISNTFLKQADYGVSFSGPEEHIEALYVDYCGFMRKTKYTDFELLDEGDKNYYYKFVIITDGNGGTYASRRTLPEFHALKQQLIQRVSQLELARIEQARVKAAKQAVTTLVTLYIIQNLDKYLTPRNIQIIAKNKITSEQLQKSVESAVSDLVRGTSKLPKTGSYSKLIPQVIKSGGDYFFVYLVGAKGETVEDLNTLNEIDEKYGIPYSQYVKASRATLKAAFEKKNPGYTIAWEKRTYNTGCGSTTSVEEVVRKISAAKKKKTPAKKKTTSTIRRQRMASYRYAASAC